MTHQDQNAFFNELYDATQEKVLIYIIVKCGNTEDIADIFQEIYTEVISVIRKCGIEYLKAPEAFVMMIAKRKVYRHYNILKRLGRLGEKCDFEEVELDNICIENVSFDENMMTKLTAKKAVDYLSEKDELTQKIFYLYYYMDKPIREIAELLSVKESNVKNRLYRTLKELREYLL